MDDVLLVYVTCHVFGNYDTENAVTLGISCKVLSIDIGCNK